VIKRDETDAINRRRITVEGVNLSDEEPAADIYRQSPQPRTDASAADGTRRREHKNCRICLKTSRRATKRREVLTHSTMQRTREDGEVGRHGYFDRLFVLFPLKPTLT
jgi:hypothetical protein